MNVGDNVLKRNEKNQSDVQENSGEGRGAMSLVQIEIEIELVEMEDDLARNGDFLLLQCDDEDGGNLKGR